MYSVDLKAIINNEGPTCYGHVCSWRDEYRIFQVRASWNFGEIWEAKKALPLFHTSPKWTLVKPNDHVTELSEVKHSDTMSSPQRAKSSVVTLWQRGVTHFTGAFLYQAEATLFLCWQLGRELKMERTVSVRTFLSSLTSSIPSFHKSCYTRSWASQYFERTIVFLGGATLCVPP